MTQLELRSVGFAHRHGPAVLEEVTVRAERRRVALLGANGSGKTTLLKLLAGVWQPTSGAVVLDGAPLRDRRGDRDRVRRSVQLVLQEPDDQLFATTVREDVSYGPANLGLTDHQVRERVDAVLAGLGIAELADRVPHLLSYGQKKKVALAGALAMQPGILLLDEPTAGLDARGTAGLMEHLARVHAAGTGIVLCTHDTDLAWAWADDVWVLHRADETVPSTLTAGPVREVLRREDWCAAVGLAPAWGVAVSEALGRVVTRPDEVAPGRG